MVNLKNFFIKIVCLSLLISSFPILPSVGYAGGCTDPVHFENKKKCDGTEDDNPALVWKEEVCDCVQSTKSSGYQDEFDECKNNTDIDEKERHFCYMGNGLEAAGLSTCGGFLESFDKNEQTSQTNSKPQGGKNLDNCTQSLGYSSGLANWTSTFTMMNFLLMFIIWFTQKNAKMDSNLCASTKFLSAAAIVGVGNELINYFMFESELRDLQVSYYQDALCDTSLSKDSDSISSTTTAGNTGLDTGDGCRDKDPLQAQETAFNYLLQERQASARTYTKKAWGYGIAAGIYTIAVIAAAIDMYTSVGTKSGKTCYLAAAPTNNIDLENKKFTFLNTIQTIINNFVSKIIPNSVADSKSISSNLQGGSLSGLAHFFKWESYKCDPSNSDPKYNYDECMQCMMGQSSQKMTANDKPQRLNCGKEEYKNDAHPLLWKLFWMGFGGLAFAGGAAIASTQKLSNLAITLIGQMVVSTIAAILSWIHMGFMISEAKVANEQAVIIEGIRDKFIGAITLDCPNGRENPDELACYCFNEDSSRRTDREESQACQSLYQSLDQKYDLESGDLFMGEKAAKLGCVARDGSPDPKCDCKKFVDQKSGKNACYQIPLTTGTLGKIATGTGADQILNSANQLTGSQNGADLNNLGSIFNAAKNLGQVKKKLLGEINDKLRQKGKPELNIGKDKIAAIVQSVNDPKLLSELKKSSPVTTTSNFSDNKLLQNAKEKIKKVDLKFNEGKGFQFNSPKEAKNNFNMDFENSSSNEKTTDFMEKNYKYNNEDIVKNNGASIWKVITNRYNNTAYERLFSEE